MKYDVKTLEMPFLLIMPLNCMSKWCLQNVFIFIRPIIEQTKVHSKILELFDISWYETLTSCCTSALNGIDRLTVSH